MKTLLKKWYAFLLLVIVIFFWLSICSFSFADLWGYTIDNYQSIIELNKQWELLVNEIIDVTFSEPRHWIYRIIPTHYKGNAWKTIKTKIYDTTIDGYQFTTDRAWDNYKIKIGSPDFMVNWSQRYNIKYKVYWGIKEFWVWTWKYQELYWNMLGTERNTLINNFSFSFTLPTNLTLQDQEYYAISGRYWERSPVALDKNWAIITTQAPLNLQENEGVTLAVKLPSDYVKLDWRKDFPWWYLLFIIPLWIGTYLFNIWRKYGKDEEVRDIIYYTPPKWYTPWQIASISSKNPTNISIFSTIYSWATDGYIKIKHEKWTWWLGKDTFSIEKINENPNMVDFEKELWNFFFNKGDSFSFWQENQSRSNHNKLTEIWENCYNSIKYFLFTPKSLWWKEKLKSINSIFIVGIFLSIWCAWFFWISFGEWWIYIFINLILVLILLSIFWKYIDKLSPEGKELYEQVIGYKKYLKTVEEPKLQQLIKDDLLYFERVLPFAVALWMETEWIQKCTIALQNTGYTPVWIHGSGFNSNSMGNIASSMNSSIKGFGSASAFSAPSSRWGGGFSGGWGGWWGGGSW